MSLSPLDPGTPIAPGYEVIAHLSRGRRLDVYDAWDHARGCRCVVKALRPERLGDARAREKLLEEGRLLCRLAHPHLVRGYEVLAEPEPLVVMETLGGQTLAHMIDSDGPLGSADVAQVGLQLGSAVHYLHDNGVLHLDLKPSNVVAEAGRAKLIDLSVARPPGPARDGIGTPSYMAPEQATGGALGPAADVWGIGAVLFEAAVGEPPFDEPDGDDGDYLSGSSSDLDTYTGPWPQLERAAARVDELAEVPAALGEVVAACLRGDPAKRPTVAAAIAALEPLTGMSPSQWRWQAARVDSVSEWPSPTAPRS
jgi:eukaryotic-like serine/threonine-protein kinase